MARTQDADTAARAIDPGAVNHRSNITGEHPVKATTLALAFAFVVIRTAVAQAQAAIGGGGGLGIFASV